MSGIRLIKVTFRNYKVLENKEVSFEENPFVIAESNEWGKSTLFEGIVDAFGLKPASVSGKATLGGEHEPYIEVEFDLDGEKYRLALNAQDGTVELVGDDGKLIRRNERNIKKFFEEKGYAHFADVVERLLVLRERDLSVGISSGLKKLLDDVLKTASIEELDRNLKGMISSKGEKFIGSLGKLHCETGDELKALNEKVQNLLKERAEYEHNVKVLGELSGRLKELEAAEGDLNQELSEKRTFFIAVLECLEEFVSSRMDELKKQISSVDAESREKEEMLSRLEGELKQVQERLKELLQKTGELQRVEDALKDLKRLCDIWENTKGVVKRELEDELSAWGACEKMLKETRGIIEVVEALGDVWINGNVYAPGERVTFEGEAEVKSGSLVLRVFASEGVERAKKRMEELSQRYKDMERLRELLDAVTTRDELARNLRCKSHEEAVARRAELEKRLEELKRASDELRLLEEKEKRLSEDVKSLRAELEEARKSKQTLEKELSNWGMFKEQIEEKLKRLGVELEKESVSFDIAGQAFSVVVRECGNVESARSKVAEIERELGELSKKLSELKEQKSKLQREVDYYKGLTRKAPDSEDLEKLLEKKRQLEARLGAMEHATRVVKYALRVLGRLKGRVNRKYLEKFNEIVGENFSKMTGGRYKDVVFEGGTLFFDESGFKKGWKVRRSDGVEFSIDELSDGTKTQLLLAARLALVRLFLKKPAFLLLDEPFAYFDPERTKEALGALEKLAKSGWQVIITTAKPLPTPEG